jgi:hypothetical protein
MPPTFFLFNYNDQQVEDVLQEENLWTFFRTQQDFSTAMHQVLQLCPNTGKAIASIRDRSVYEYDRGPAKASVTATFAFYVSGTMLPCMVIYHLTSHSGMMFPCMLIYPHQRLPSDITQTVPDDWKAGHSSRDGCQ